jgi:predicted dienelactone hydrolase
VARCCSTVPCLSCGLTLHSTERAAAFVARASFHSGPAAACCRTPVSFTLGGSSSDRDPSHPLKPMTLSSPHLPGTGTSLLSRFAAALLFSGAAQLAAAAGVSTTIVPAAGQDRSLEVLVWSPCALAPPDLRMGPYSVRAVKDCPVLGRSLPLVVFSHGQGGTRLGHHDTASALADAGFIVASFNHPGDTFGDDSAASEVGIFESRPADVSRVITHMLEQWKDRQLVDAQSVGAFGFSRGGYTALALVGAQPSRTASAERFCGSWRSFLISLCRRLGNDAVALKARADPRVKSVVAVDPLNLFSASSLKAVRAPVQLWASELGGDGVELAHTQLIQRWLPNPPEYHMAKGAGHFVFLAPCPEEFRKEARRICEDPRGISRESWHSSMNQTVVAFFTRTLRSGVK